jgi:hypothetical protein
MGCLPLRTSCIPCEARSNRGLLVSNVNPIALGAPIG